MIPKIYRIIAILMISSCCCISCIKTYECLPISIRNGTDETIHITVFPQGDTTGFCYLYEEGSGGCRVSKFDLLPYYGNESNWWNEIIFISHDLDIKPYSLALREFDSIRITTADHLIIFNHENVTGYSENIFSENSTWDFQVGESYEYAFTKRKEKYYHYVYIILEDKIIKKNGG